MSKHSGRSACLTFIPALFILGAFVYLSLRRETPISFYTRDVAAIANLHPLAGAISHLGCLLWCIASTACALSAAVLEDRNQKMLARFMLISSLLSLGLLIDDMFQIHDGFSVRAGLKEMHIHVLIAVAISAYLLRYGHLIWNRGCGLFISAFFLLSFSVLIDTIPTHYFSALHDWRSLLEDGPKFVGIASWCSYFVQLAYDLMLHPEVEYTPQADLGARQGVDLTTAKFS